MLFQTPLLNVELAPKSALKIWYIGKFKGRIFTRQFVMHVEKVGRNWLFVSFHIQLVTFKIVLVERRGKQLSTSASVPNGDLTGVSIPIPKFKIFYYFCTHIDIIGFMTLKLFMKLK